MTTPTNDLSQLLKDKKFDEARKVINDAVVAPMTPKEKGAALTTVAMTYVAASNKVSQDYLNALKEAIQGLKALKTAETKVTEKISLAEVRAQLDNS